ncbi:MAG TPA: type VII secretion integral membrane protein EccD [Mycobacterium sp.]|nr:type VII secretion integral membrane protein EccD [Mycobacterium sp.]
MSASNAGLRRVSVHAGNAVVDLSLPAGVPVAALIPPIVDILEGRNNESSSDLVGSRYHLSLPGASALDASTTLAQNGVRNGAVMVLSQARTPPPVPRYDDVAEAVSATLAATARCSSQPRHRQATRLTGAVVASSLTGIGAVSLIRNAFCVNGIRYFGVTAGVAALAGLVALLYAVFAHRAHADAIAGLTLSVIATVFAAAAGFLAVPGAPGVPGVLLAAMGAAVMSVLAMRLSGCGVVTLTAVSCFAIVVAIAALVGVVTAAPLHIIGSVSALVSFGLLGVAARASIVLAGLSPRLPPAPDLDTADCLAAKAVRADNWLTSLLAAFSCSAAAGAILTVLTGTARFSCIAFATVTGSLLLLYARCIDRRRTLMFVVSGIATTGTTFGVTAASTPDHGPWIAAMTAMLAAAAIYLGFVAPARSLSPVVRRSAELLEFLALIALVPLTCWICGLYGTVRGLHPTWS